MRRKDPETRQGAMKKLEGGVHIKYKKLETDAICVSSIHSIGLRALKVLRGLRGLRVRMPTVPAKPIIFVQ